jgi:hypothetical protein
MSGLIPKDAKYRTWIEPRPRISIRERTAYFGAQPDSQITSKAARMRPSESAKRLL